MAIALAWHRLWNATREFAVALEPTPGALEMLRGQVVSVEDLMCSNSAIISALQEAEAFLNRSPLRRTKSRNRFSVPIRCASNEVLLSAQPPGARSSPLVPMINQTNYRQISLLASQLRLAPDALVALCIAAGLKVETADDFISPDLANEIADLAALVNRAAKARLPPAQQEEPMSTWLTPYLSTTPFLLAEKLLLDTDDVLTACRESGIGPKEAGTALDVREQKLVLSKLSVDPNLAEIVGPLNNDEYEALFNLRYDMYQVFDLLHRKPLGFDGSAPLEFAWRLLAYFGVEQEIVPLKALEKAAWDLAASAAQHHYSGCRLILASRELSFEDMMSCIEAQPIEWSNAECRDRRPNSELVHPLLHQGLHAFIAAIQGAARMVCDVLCRKPINLSKSA